ncbi:eph receptor tyrosine kinase [Haematobia irritans]|uniref:eph receptor tyrosine kinase n=1 Tax=Haematobia irritans TaxID=7368 RepID=UPI003F50A826
MNVLQHSKKYNTQQQREKPPDIVAAQCHCCTNISERVHENVKDIISTNQQNPTKSGSGQKQQILARSLKLSLNHLLLLGPVTLNERSLEWSKQLKEILQKCNQIQRSISIMVGSRSSNSTSNSSLPKKNLSHTKVMVLSPSMTTRLSKKTKSNTRMNNFENNNYASNIASERREYTTMDFTPLQHQVVAIDDCSRTTQIFTTITKTLSSSIIVTAATSTCALKLLLTKATTTLIYATSFNCSLSWRRAWVSPKAVTSTSSTINKNKHRRRVSNISPMPFSSSTSSSSSSISSPTLMTEASPLSSSLVNEENSCHKCLVVTPKIEQHLHCNNKSSRMPTHASTENKRLKPSTRSHSTKPGNDTAKSQTIPSSPLKSHFIYQYPVIAATLVLLILMQLHTVAADQVILLDTTREATLEWTRYPYGPQAQTPGWVEESFTDFVKGINWRSYVVCDVAYHNVNNWLWSPFIDRGPANRLYIEIQFTIRDCSLFPGNALSCKETFSLLYYEFDAATREPPPWQTDSYKLIARIAAGEGRFNQNSDVDINTEVKSIAVTKKGVYFAFRDQGACISVLAVKVYYITCPAVTENFAHFNETPTGREITIIEKQNGTCVENAEPYEQPTYLCKGDGKWTILTGGCRCKGGYEPDYANKTCNECPVGTFRSAEVGKCIPCPPNSNAPKAASSFCKCLPGFNRHPRDGKHMPCYKPPGPPTNLTLLFVDHISAILSWNAPVRDQSNADTNPNNMYRSDIVYKVVCSSCSSNVVLTPNTDTFNDTKLTLTNLEPMTTYTIQIHSMNGVSYIAENGTTDDRSGKNANDSFSSEENGGGKHDNEIPLVHPVPTSTTQQQQHNSNNQPIDLSQIKTEWDEITFTTTESAILSTVSNVRVVLATSNEVDLIWEKPVQSDAPIEFYEVRWFPKPDFDAINKTALTTKDTKAHIEALNENTEYGFQVRYKTINGYGTYSNIVYAHTQPGVGSVYEENLQMRIVAGATVAVVVILVLVIIATVVFLRSKNQDDLDKKSSNHMPLPLDYASNEGQVVTYIHAMDTTPIVKTIQSNVTTPLFGNSRSYVDPHTYEDPNQAIREFAREIDANYITIEAIIGGGEFGDVCRGRLKIPPNFVQDIDVAIKTLKPGSSEKARCDFLTEASIMGQFDHPNVIYLQGVVTRSNPVMIITEYMENGSLDTFLRVNDGKFQTLQLIVMLRGIASGMAYLSEMNYVHRDLAARNVLVNTQLICKIADFGLSREIENASDAYTTRGGKIPVRWTAPEAIAFRKFTSASDVWSYGVVLWEVMSYGERPYWNWSNQDVIKSIEKGYRLPAPMDCPEALYQLMLDCWQKQRTHRPSFASIVSTLDNLARQPQTLLTTRNSPENDGSHIMDSQRGHNIFISTDMWLDNIKMSRYSQHFKEANLVTAQQISRLTAQQLSDMGITLVGHQKKILHQARQLDTII